MQGKKSTIIHIWSRIELKKRHLSPGLCCTHELILLLFSTLYKLLKLSSYLARTTTPTLMLPPTINFFDKSSVCSLFVPPSLLSKLRSFRTHTQNKTSRLKIHPSLNQGRRDTNLLLRATLTQSKTSVALFNQERNSVSRVYSQLESSLKGEKI